MSAIGLVVVFQGLGHVATAVWYLLAARQLRVDDFGAFSFAVSIVLVLQVVIGAGLPQTIVRFGARREISWPDDSLLRRLGICVPLVMTSGLILVAWLARRIGMKFSIAVFGDDVLIWMLIAGMGASLVAVATGYLQACQRPVLATFVGSTALPVSLAVMFGANSGRAGLDFATLTTEFCAAYAVAFVLAAGLLLSVGRRDLNRDAPATMRLGEVLSFARKAFVIGLVYMGLSHLDRLMLGVLDTMEGVGLYSIPARISRLLFIVLYLFMPLVGPVFSYHLRSGDRQAALAVYRQSARLIAMLMLPAGLVLIADGRDIINLLAGAEYTAGLTTLVILVAGVLGMSLAGNTGLLLQMGGHENTELRLSLLALGLNVGLNLLLIPRFGIVGAAVGTAASYFTVSFIKIVLCYRIWRVMPPIFTDIRTLIAVSIFLLIHWFLVGGGIVGWVAGAVLGTGAYLAVARPWKTAASLATAWSLARRES